MEPRYNYDEIYNSILDGADYMYIEKKPYKKEVIWEKDPLEKVIEDYSIEQIIEKIGIDKVEDYLRTKKLLKITDKIKGK